MWATATVILMGSALGVPPETGAAGLADETKKAALLRDGEANYRPIVDYDIEVRLTPSTHNLDGRARITWKNDGRWPVSTLWWHLYLNAFRNENSTFMKEGRRGFGRGGVRDEHWGWTDVTSMSVRDLSQTGTQATVLHDVLPESYFVSPDDGNPDDRTVLKTSLPFAVPPGGRVEIELTWQARLPKVVARSGWSGSFHMVAQWFPKLGVLEESFLGPERGPDGEPAWNCHQYHATSEYFADYGSYRVQITVPREFMVGATGRQVAPAERDGDWMAYEFYQDRVHDFAWTADSRFIVRRFKFDPAQITPEERNDAAEQLGLQPDELQLTPVEVTMLLQPEHEVYASRYQDAVENGLKWLGLWFGRYPYSTLTVVDGPREGMNAMGMEYPTLITGGVRWPSPAASHSPQQVTVHEFAHQFWYGLVGSNEFEEAWLDEGLTTFSTGLVFDKVYGPTTPAARFFGLPLTPWFKTVTLSSLQQAQLGNILAPDTDAVAQPAWTYRSGFSYGVNSYPRAQLALIQLGHVIGQDKVLQGLRIYQQRWRYRHPTTRDLQAAFEEASGRSLAAFFDATVFRAAALDYSVASIDAERIDVAAGVFERHDKGHRVVSSTQAVAESRARPDERVVYLNEVVVQRDGELMVPVTVEVQLSDGLPYRANWNGRGRWHRIAFESPHKAISAQLYAETPRPFDARPSNDTILEASDPAVGLSWVARGLFGLQNMIQLLGGLL